MSEGIRIQPRPGLNFPPGAAMVVVVDHDRPLLPMFDGEGRPVPLERTQPICEVCEKAQNGYAQHLTKAYHIQLDTDGTAIVSQGVWAGLQRCANQPFEPVNPVPNPPTQHLLLPPASLAFIPSTLES